MLAATDAIVLRSRKQGDTSKIVTLYTREFGLIDVIAKGARQSKSKFGAALEPFTLSKIAFYKKEHTSLYLLSGAEVTTAHRNLTNDLEHIEAVTKIAELLIRSQHHEEQHTELFKLVAQTMDAINASSVESVLSVVISFYVKYTELSGFGFSLEALESDGEESYFDAERGEFFLRDGSPIPEGGRFIAVSSQLAASLKYLTSHTIEEAGSLRLNEASKYGLEALFRAYFNFHIEGMQTNRTKAGRVFASMNK